MLDPFHDYPSLKAARGRRLHPLAAALACSTAFLTPIAHPVNLLVMGPGGYTPRDFFKVGLPLTIVVFIVMLIVLPRVWRL